MVQCPVCDTIFDQVHLIEHEKCPVCFTELPESALNKTAESKYLLPDGSNYDRHKYAKPLFTVDALIVRMHNGKLQLLTITRKYEPCKGQLALPGGYVEIANNEHPDVAAARELFEETGIEGTEISQLQGFKIEDPRDYSITMAYYALLNSRTLGKLAIKGGDDAEEECKWVDLCPTGTASPLAFSHNQVVETLVKRVFTMEGLMSALLRLVDPLHTTSREVASVVNALFKVSGSTRFVRLGAHLNSFLLTRGFKLEPSGEVDKNFERGRPTNFVKIIKVDDLR